MSLIIEEQDSIIEILEMLFVLVSEALKERFKGIKSVRWAQGAKERGYLSYKPHTI